MASRDWLKHLSSTTEPNGATLGDEWYNSSTNKFFKRLAVNGTTVSWRELAPPLTVQSGGTTISTGATTLNFIGATITADGTGGVLRITAGVSAGGADTQVQYNVGGGLGGSSNFTWTNGTNTLTASNVSSTGITSTNITANASLSAGISGSIDPSIVNGFAAGQINETTTGFAAPGIVIGAGSGQHGAIVYGSGTMYFGTEIAATDNSMTTRMTLTSAGLFIPSLTTGRVTFATTSGQLTDSANLTWNGSTLGVTGFVSTNQITGNHGVSTASWTGAQGLGFRTGGTLTDTASSGTIASRVANSFNATTFAASLATTVTSAINLFVDAPTAGANTTITTPWAVYSQGNTRSTGILVCDTTIQQSAGLYYQSVNSAVSTAGSVQGDATAIAVSINNITTVGASTQGVRLPAITLAGTRVLIRNATATACNVYPQSGAAINSLGTNTAFVLNGSTTLEFVAMTTTLWVTTNATFA